MFRCSLTAEDLARCQLIADQISSNSREYKQRYGAHKRVTDPETLNLNGVLGEYALAKYLGWAYWYTEYDPSAYDVAGYEVRSTRHANGHLITHPGDKPGIYVLAIIEAENMVRLHGWRTLKTANMQRHWRNDMHTPCYMTPQAELWPMDMLPATELYLCGKTD